MDFNNSPRHVRRALATSEVTVVDNPLPSTYPIQFISRLSSMVRQAEPPTLSGDATSTSGETSITAGLFNGNYVQSPPTFKAQETYRQEQESYSVVAPLVVPTDKFLGEVKLRYKPTPVVKILDSGERIETYMDGAWVSKDSLGRVLEVNSSYGESLTFTYNFAGDLVMFTRFTNDKQVDYLGERHQQSVVVRNRQGKTYFTGDSMSVDRIGCLSVYKKDGEFIALDLVRSFHTERRQAVDQSGMPHIMTAIFGYDGFRLATRFQKCYHNHLHAPVCSLRFYGRDGSRVFFNSEEELRAFQPSQVLLPGSVFVEPVWRGKRQANTAWEAVFEYLAMLT